MTESTSVRRGARRIAIAAFALFVALRLIAWSNSSLLEDHDSVSYLIAAETFASFDLSQIAALSPDTTPLYPILVALAAAPGWSTTTAARLASLAMACLLFWSLVGLGRWMRIGHGVGLAAALVFAAVNPTLVDLGYSVLSEPTYLGLVYLGLWWFVAHERSPRIRDAIVLGLLTAAAFLTRIEGLLLVAVYPTMLLLDAAFRGTLRGRMVRIVTWSAALAVGFVLLATPQIAWVSARLGQPAINGRQVWMAIMSAPGEASYEQRIYGVGHDEGQVNLEYFQANPQALSAQRTSADLTSLVRIVARTTDELWRDKLGQLLGPLMLMLIGFGVAGLLRRGEGRRLALLSIWISSSVVGPLLYNVADRHIAIILPAALLIAGVGVDELSRMLKETLGARARPVVIGVATLAAASLAVPVYRATIGLPEQGAYDPVAVDAIAALLRADADSAGIDVPIVCARNSYLPHAAGGRKVPLPYTDASGLARYLDATEADYLFLEHPAIGVFPLAREFATPGAPLPSGLSGLVVLDRRPSHQGGQLELYRIP